MIRADSKPSQSEVVEQFRYKYHEAMRHSDGSKTPAVGRLTGCFPMRGSHIQRVHLHGPALTSKEG